jgi:hypothetical protein
MKTIHILAEGQTEETFVRQILGPHLAGSGLFLNPILVITRRDAGSSAFRGGSVPYGRLKKDILRLLGDSSAVLVTTMLDYYGLGHGFPGRDTMPADDCYRRVAYLEDAFASDVNDPRFLPYLMLHEFEAMLFVAPDQVAALFPKALDAGERLVAIRKGFRTPEEIDERPEACPSARILECLPEYKKTLHGSLAISRIGLARIRMECEHFNYWLTRLETLS